MPALVFHTKNRNFGDSLAHSLLGFSCTPQGCSLCTQGRTILLCCPIPLPSCATLSCGGKEPLAQTGHRKSSNEIFFLLSSSRTKVSLNGGELNNFRQKFLIYCILQLDTPHPRAAGFTWTQLQDYLNPAAGLQGSGCTVLTISVFSEQFWQYLSSAPLCPCGNELPRNGAASLLPRAQVLPRWHLHPVSCCGAFFIKRTPACQENPTNGLWINHS